MSRLTWRIGASALVVAGAIGLAGCGGDAGASATPLPPGVVAVEAREYRFTPKELTVPAGQVTFAVKNAGTTEHEFEIFQGDQVLDEVEGLVPGLTKDLTVTLQPGTYTFFCKLNGHDQLGMMGTITVQ